MSEQQQARDCLTISVPEAGKQYFGLSRNGSYEAATRGEIPTIRIGRKLRVPIAAMERMLDQAQSRPQIEKAPKSAQERREQIPLGRNPLADLDPTTRAIVERVLRETGLAHGRSAP